MAVSRRARIVAAVAVVAAAVPLFLPGPGLSGAAQAAPGRQQAMAGPDTLRALPVLDVRQARTVQSIEPVVLRAGQITSFETIRGQAQWEAGYRNRVQQATWTFGGGGIFTFNTLDVRTDLYPLQGHWQLNGSTVTFSANGSAQIGGSSVFTEMIGSIDLSGTQAIMQLGWASGAGFGAVVDNQPFGSTASATYKAVLTVVKG